MDPSGFTKLEKRTLVNSCYVQLFSDLSNVGLEVLKRGPQLMVTLIRVKSVLQH